MCGSCQEFAPTWEKVEKSMRSIATAKVNIDEKGGMAVAQAMGALEDGLPNIRLYHRKSNGSNSKDTAKAIVSGDILPYKKIMQNIRAEVGGKLLSKSCYVKRSITKCYVFSTG